jgi:hypothetical protein
MVFVAAGDLSPAVGRGRLPGPRPGQAGRSRVFPVFLALILPGESITRHVIAYWLANPSKMGHFGGLALPRWMAKLSAEGGGVDR